MPKKLERQLKAQARKKGLSGERADAYVYGTMRKTGWRPSREKHKKQHVPGGSTHERIEMSESVEVCECDTGEYGEDYEPK